MRQNMARFNIIRHYVLRIVGRLQLTGLLRWANADWFVDFLANDGLDEGPMMLQKT